MKTDSNMNALTGREFFRLIAKMGGLWNVSSLSSLCGATARSWPTSPEFPAAAWKVGRTRLWAGWEVWLWLEETGRVDAANKLHTAMTQLGRTSRKELLDA